MKSMIELTQSILADASVWCCTSTTRDIETVTSRYEHEGESFLTITLPSFCRDFEFCLDRTWVAPGSFQGFSSPKGSALPRFLRGLLELVFCPETGLLLNAPSETAIFFVRQITLLHKKVLLPCSEKRIRDAYRKYIQCEKDVRDFEESVSDFKLDSFGRVADLLWGPDCSVIDRKVYDGDHIPKHGPGSTADKLFGNEKYDCRTWHSRLEGNFPSDSFLLANFGYQEVLNRVTYLEPGAEIPVQVKTVPKTLKTPRIIAVEPTCMQYAQQSLMEIIVSQLETSNYVSGMVGFTDQCPNQDMARLGSLGSGLATIDLSEASDRVSNLLVKRMLKNFPTFCQAVQDCRSTHADVPGFGVQALAKFASMGSALCFPMEAMVFLTIIFVALEEELNRPLTPHDIQVMRHRVRVYGDDIIVPIELVPSVISTLERYALKVNHNKSFWTGKFRESCGRDYYNGYDVSVTYNRRVFPESRRNASEVISLVSLRNQLYKAGLWRTVKYLDDFLAGLAAFPVVLETSPIIGRTSFLGYEAQRMCESLHRPLVKGFVVKSRPKSSPISGHGALLKFFLKRGREPIFDVKHLERYGRPDAVDIKLRWASPT